MNRDFSRAGSKRFREGIFCDCYGTLFDYSWVNGRLVEYLNAQHDAGKKVVLVTSGMIGAILAEIRKLGLREEIVSSLTEKRRLDRWEVETLIDDEPPHYVTAQKIWDPVSPEFDAFLKTQTGKNEPQPQPGPT